MSDDLKTLLDEWKALEAAATPRLWAYHPFGRGGDPEPTTIAIHTGDFDWDDLASRDSETAVAWMSNADSHQMYDDAAFIAASRTIVPRLIAAVEAVLAEERVPDDEWWAWGYNAALDDVTDRIRAALIGDDDE